MRGRVEEVGWVEMGGKGQGENKRIWLVKANILYHLYHQPGQVVFLVEKARCQM